MMPRPTHGLAVLVLAACARLPGRAPAPVPLVAAADTTWYISVRARERGQDTRRLADSLRFGLVVFERRPKGAPSAALGNNAWRDVSHILTDSVELTRADFQRLLQRRLAGLPTAERFAVLYVHGFGTSLGEAWMYATTASVRSLARSPWVVFCWPSNGAGFAWPSRSAIVERAYRDDSIAAQMSQRPFTETLGWMLDAVGAESVLLATHSLGVQVAAEPLATSDGLRARLGAAPLRAIAFLAPDSEARRFGDYLVPALRPLARRLVLYASARDRALAVAREIHGSARAGLVQRHPLMRDGLETVETTAGKAEEGWVQRIVGTHHAIGRQLATLFDLAHVVGAQRSPTCRALLGTGAKDARGAWQLTRAPLPEPAQAARCQPYER